MSEGGQDLKWYHLSVCQGMTTEYFYDEYESDPVLADTMDGICLSCPVRTMCLGEGMRNKDYGLWGGWFLTAGRIDEQRNAHKSRAVREALGELVSDDG